MLLAAVTFPLIWVGGLVTTYDAGMAVDDWPSTFGYNLFLYPWTTWVYGPWNLFIEHGHRLLGALAGMVSIVLVAVTWRHDPRPWVWWLTVGALVLVSIQGVLGGARVLLDERTLALVHGCVGPAFFAYVAGLMVVTSRWWIETKRVEHPQAMPLQRLALILVSLAYFQLIVGAHIRHAPPGGSPDAFRIAVIFHLGIAFVLLAHSLVAAAKGWSRGVVGPIRWPLTLLAILITAQIILGGSVWLLKYGWPFGLSESWQVAGTTIVARSFLQSMITTSHVAMGSLILALSVLVGVRSLRCFRTKTAAVAPGVLQWGVAR
jgi:heme a synthase